MLSNFQTNRLVFNVTFEFVCSKSQFRNKMLPTIQGNKDNVMTDL